MCSGKGKSRSDKGLIENIVECKYDRMYCGFWIARGLIENIVECKYAIMAVLGLPVKRLIENIVECKSVIVRHHAVCPAD